MAGEWRGGKKEGKGTLFVVPGSGASGGGKLGSTGTLTLLSTAGGGAATNSSASAGASEHTPMVVHGGAGTYVGLFEGDVKSGLGTMTFPDGSVYKVAAGHEHARDREEMRS